jgi:hypothetical protein
MVSNIDLSRQDYMCRLTCNELSSGTVRIEPCGHRFSVFADLSKVDKCPLEECSKKIVRIVDDLDFEETARAALEALDLKEKKLISKRRKEQEKQEEALRKQLEQTAGGSSSTPALTKDVLAAVESAKELQSSKTRKNLILHKCWDCGNYTNFDEVVTAIALPKVLGEVVMAYLEQNYDKPRVDFCLRYNLPIIRFGRLPETKKSSKDRLMDLYSTNSPFKITVEANGNEGTIVSDGKAIYTWTNDSRCIMGQGVMIEKTCAHFFSDISHITSQDFDDVTYKVSVKMLELKKAEFDKKQKKI